MQQLRKVLLSTTSARCSCCHYCKIKVVVKILIAFYGLELSGQLGVLCLWLRSSEHCMDCWSHVGSLLLYVCRAWLYGLKSIEQLGVVCIEMEWAAWYAMFKSSMFKKTRWRSTRVKSGRCIVWLVQAIGGGRWCSITKLVRKDASDALEADRNSTEVNNFNSNTGPASLSVEFQHQGCHP